MQLLFATLRILASLSFSKTATALRNTLFSDINISQGSVVTRFRCDGMFNDNFIANFQKIVKMKKFWKLASIWWSYVSNTIGSFFSGHGVVDIAYKWCAYIYRLTLLYTTASLRKQFLATCAQRRVTAISFLTYITRSHTHMHSHLL